MRKVIYMLAATISLVLLSGQIYAQRCLPGTKGVKLWGGFAEGSRSPLNHYARFAVSGYTKKANRRITGAGYLLKNYEYRNVPVPRAQFTVEGRYYPKFLSDPPKALLLSIGGSALAGHETVNWGNKMLHDGSKLFVKDAFIYGGTITLKFKAYVTDRIVLLTSIRECAMRGGSLSVFTM